MHICYIDESGTPEIPGTTTHFVLAGFAMPIGFWRKADQEITKILLRYGLDMAEFHTAWLLRAYSEQGKITGFENLSWPERRREVEKARYSELYRLRKLKSTRPHNQAKKNYRHTSAYIHLTQAERLDAARAVADCIAGWFSRSLRGSCR